MLNIFFKFFILSSVAILLENIRAKEATNLHQNSTQTSSDHHELKQWHDICLEGNTKKIAQQIKKFESKIAHNPSNNLARAYLGSAYALKAKYSFFPTTKLSSLKKGKIEMDAAVASAPNQPRVRMVRAIAYLKVPKRFDTRATSIQDFEKLLIEVKDPKSTLELVEKQAALYYASLAFAQTHHHSAHEAKKLCHQIDPHSKYGKLTK